MKKPTNLLLSKLLKLMAMSAITLSFSFSFISNAQSLDPATAAALAGAISSNPTLLNIRIAPNISFGNQPTNTVNPVNAQTANASGAASVSPAQGAAVPQVGADPGKANASIGNGNTASAKKAEPVIQDIGYQQKLADDALMSQSTVVPTGLEEVNKTTIDYYAKFGQEREQQRLMQGASK